MKRTTTVTAVAICAVALAACGSSKKSTTQTQTQTQSPAPPAAAGATVALQADPSGALKFNSSAATAKAGVVTLTMKNPSPVQHGIAIQGNGVSQSGQIVGSGATSTVTVTLKPGTYTFYCPVAGHRQAGMQGTLTVH